MRKSTAAQVESATDLLTRFRQQQGRRKAEWQDDEGTEAVLVHA
jgi:hypothetical protein